ncbi:MAG TPA: hypothetical protein VFR86_09035, partial [Burkholderiaceae bacterium]|nr:hypothetical protein [Burkholderiaceae bacterium]
MIGLNSLKLGAKLSLAPVVSVVMLLSVAAAAYYGMQSGRQALDQITNARTPNLLKAIELANHVQRTHTLTLQLLAWINGSYPPARLKEIEDDIKKSAQVTIKTAEEVAQFMEGGSSAGSKGEALVKRATAYTREILGTADMASTDQSFATTMMIRSEKQFGEIMKGIEEIRADQSRLTAAAVADAAKGSESAVGIIIVVAALSIGMSLVISLAVRRSILRPVDTMRESARRLKEGDLSAMPQVEG